MILKPITDEEINQKFPRMEGLITKRDLAEHFKREGAREMLEIWETYSRHYSDFVGQYSHVTGDTIDNSHAFFVLLKAEL